MVGQICPPIGSWWRQSNQNFDPELFTILMGLGNVCEQTGESGHADWDKFCHGRLPKNIDDPEYLPTLRKLVVEYACKHRKRKLCV